MLTPAFVVFVMLQDRGCPAGANQTFPSAKPRRIAAVTNMFPGLQPLQPGTRRFRRLHQLRGPQIVQMNDAQQSVLLVDDHERGNSFFFHDGNG
jgi:hypothetical protein